MLLRRAGPPEDASLCEEDQEGLSEEESDADVPDAEERAGGREADLAPHEAELKVWQLGMAEPTSV